MAQRMVVTWSAFTNAGNVARRILGQVPVRRSFNAAIAVASFVLIVVTAPDRGLAFSESQIDKVFAMLDSNRSGKVDRVEYDYGKVAAMFPPINPDTLEVGKYRFEDTPFNRAFFDAADQDHKGSLDVMDLIYALKFDAIDTDRKGYITINDLRRFMNKIGR